MLDQFWPKQQLRQWTRKAAKAARIDFATLARQREDAKALKTQIDRLIGIADTRLREVAKSDRPMPHDTDWLWSPPLWVEQILDAHEAPVVPKTPLDPHVTVFHDCPLSEIICKQVLTHAPDGTPSFGVAIGVYHFEGTFMSLAIDIPQEGSEDLGRANILQVDMDLDLETPVEVFARLNLKHGPNTEQMVQELDHLAKQQRFEFDLAYSNLRERPVERAWVDLIFEKPRMNQLVLSDLVFSRRRRAPL